MAVVDKCHLLLCRDNIIRNSAICHYASSLHEQYVQHFLGISDMINKWLSTYTCMFVHTLVTRTMVLNNVVSAGRLSSLIVVCFHCTLYGIHLHVGVCLLLSQPTVSNVCVAHGT